MFLEANIEKIKIATGWEPKTSFEDGIRETISFYKEKNS